MKNYIPNAHLQGLSPDPLQTLTINIYIKA